MRLLVLRLCLFQLDLVNLDSELRVGEGVVDLEFVPLVYFPSLRRFRQGTNFSARHGLERAFEFRFGKSGCGEKFGVGEGAGWRDVVEKEKDNCLEGGDREFFFALLEGQKNTVDKSTS